MKILLWFIIVIVGINLFFRLMGPTILRALVRWINKKAQQDMDKQSRVYREKAESNSPFEDNYFFGDEIKVTVPKNQRKADLKKDPKGPAQDVDYEDVK